MQACLKKLFQGKLFPLYPLLPFSRRKNSNRAVKDVFFGVKPHSFFSGRRATLKKKNLGPLLRFFFAFLRLVLSFFFWKIFFSGFLASPAHLAEPWKVVASGPWKVFCRRFLLSLKCSCCWKIFKKRQKHEFFGKAAHLSPIWLLCFTTPGHPKKWLPPQGKILWCGIRNPGPKGRKKNHRTSFYAAKYLRTRKYTMQKAKRKKKWFSWNPLKEFCKRGQTGVLVPLFAVCNTDGGF